jgi:hypothetical protein
VIAEAAEGRGASAKTDPAPLWWSCDSAEPPFAHHFRAGVKCQKSAIEGACRDTHNDIRADTGANELCQHTHLDSAQTIAAGSSLLRAVTDLRSPTNYLVCDVPCKPRR